MAINSINEKFDIIAVMTSGVPYTADIFDTYSKCSEDARLLSFYPIYMTPDAYETIANENVNSSAIVRMNRKYNHFQFGMHTHLDEFLELKRKITGKEICENCNKYDRTYEEAKYNLSVSIWNSLVQNIIKTGNVSNLDISKQEFFSSPKLRLSNQPDPRRTAILCDDYVYEASTLTYAVYEMFKLGYTKVKFFSDTCSYDIYDFEGDYDAFKKKYDNPCINQVERDILKNIF